MFEARVFHRLTDYIQTDYIHVLFSSIISSSVFIHYIDYKLSPPESAFFEIIPKHPQAD